MLFRHKQFTKPITFFFEKSEQNNALMFLAKEKSGRNIEFDIFIQRPVRITNVINLALINNENLSFSDGRCLNLESITRAMVRRIQED